MQQFFFKRWNVCVIDHDEQYFTSLERLFLPVESEKTNAIILNIKVITRHLHKDQLMKSRHQNFNIIIFFLVK